jgi:hypothetical protein
VPEKARVDPGEAQRQGLPVHLDGAVLQRPDQVVRGVLEREQIAAVRPPLEFGDRDERLDRAVAGPAPCPPGMRPPA